MSSRLAPKNDMPTGAWPAAVPAFTEISGKPVADEVFEALYE